MQIAQAVERNTQTIAAYGRYCAEMHRGISDNRDMITADRNAASKTRVEVAGIRREVTEITECMENNNTAIDERFIVLE
jgi:hypothetical protein